MNLHQKIEKLIQEHIKEHQSEINVAKELLNKLDISSSNKLTQDYSFNLTLTGEKIPVLESKSKYYYDWDRNGKIVNPFFEIPDYTELPD